MLNAAVTFLKNLMGFTPAVKLVVESESPYPRELAELVLLSLGSVCDDKQAVPPGTYTLIAANLQCSYSYVTALAGEAGIRVLPRKA